jgi:hypothetical protein
LKPSHFAFWVSLEVPLLPAMRAEPAVGMLEAKRKNGSERASRVFTTEPLKEDETKGSRVN